MKKNIFYTAFSILASIGFGYFLGKIIDADEPAHEEDPQIKNLHLRNEILSRQLSNSKAKIKSLEDKIAKLENPSSQKTPESFATDKSDTLEKAHEVFGKTVKINDLKLIEGIGPKIELILKARGIDSWEKLSEQNSEDLRKILIEDGGEQYHIHNPETWPKQAKLAAESKWDELKLLQEKI